MDAAAGATDNEDNESGTGWPRVLLMVCLLGFASAAILIPGSAESPLGVGAPSSAPPILPPHKGAYLTKATAAALRPALSKAAAPSVPPTRLPTRPSTSVSEE